MKKIITAINNQILNEELNKEKDVEIICKDIQYKEGILEILEINFEVDYIFINYNLPGEISIEYLINKIFRINENIKLIIFLKKENINNFSFLEKENIKIIFFEDKIDLKLLINNNIKYKCKNLEKNKKINSNFFQNEKVKKFLFLNNKLIKNKFNINNNNLFKKEKINNRNFYFKENKIITFSGNRGVGKSLIIINFAFYLKNKKILILDFNLENINIYNFLGVKKLNHNSNKKIEKAFFINKIKINKYKKIINKFSIRYFNISILNNLIIKINKNINLLSYTKLINYNKLKEIKKDYDFILIEMPKNINKKLYKDIILNSFVNIILIEPNLNGIHMSKKDLNEIYSSNIKNKKILLNKNNNYSIDKKILNNIFPNIKIIGKIEYKKIYNFLINNNFKNNYLFNSKKIINENKIIFNNLK